MLSRTAEYALRVIVFLAAQDKQPATTRVIAQATAVPEGYLSKVLQALGRAGLVASQRGLHGGFTIGRDPGDLNVHEVIAAVEPVQRIHCCPVGIESHNPDLCALHKRLDDAMAMVEEAFRNSKISELLAADGAHRPLFDPAAAGNGQDRTQK